MKSYFIPDFKSENYEDFSKNHELLLDFPIFSIGFTNSPLDIVSDFAELSYCCEKIAPLIKIISAEVKSRDIYYKKFEIKCEVNDHENLYNELLFFSEINSEENQKYDDRDRISFYDEIKNFEKRFHINNFSFPELVNDYYANLVNGGYWELASEYEPESIFFNKVYKKFPEHRFGFWKSPESNGFSNKVYFSIENWIVPPETNFTEAMKFHSGLENEIKFEKAEVVYYKGKTILLTDSTAIYFYQRKQLNNSIKCVELVFYKDDITSNNQKKYIEKDLFGEPIKHKRKRINYSKEIEIIENDLKYSVSEFGDILCIEYKNYNHIFFQMIF